MLQPIKIDDTLQNHVSVAVKKANEIVIATEQDLTTSTDIIKFIKEKAKQVEAQRKNFVDPINASVKNINATFKTLSEPLENAEKILKGKMLDFQRKLEAEKRAAIEAERREVEEYAKQIAEKHIEEGRLEQAATLINQLDTAMQKPVEIEKVRGGATNAVSSITKRWTFKVIDIQILAASRPDLVEVISAQVRKEISAGARKIAGLEIYKEESLSIR